METNVNNTFFTGKFLIHLPSVDSTNNYAKNYITKNSPIDGTVILTDEQYAGRGQTNNVWQSDANKNLTFSIIYKTNFLLATEQFYLSMAVSLGIWSVLNNQITGVKIKWPNDIYVANKKIAGILIENTIAGMHLKYSIIGIGLNVNQDIFTENINATSLKILLKRDTNRNEFLNAILIEIEKYFFLLKERKFELLKRDYLNNLYRYNTMSSYKKEDMVFKGKIIDVDETGILIIELHDGIMRFDFKEINFII